MSDDLFLILILTFLRRPLLGPELNPLAKASSASKNLRVKFFVIPSPCWENECRPSMHYFE